MPEGMNTEGTAPLRIAVIGGGVAGVTASYLLQQSHHITLYEKNHYIGGHTNTIVIDKGPDAGTPVDTGFIVLNDRTYPNFNRLLERLRVPTRDSDMSFSYWDEVTDFQYNGTDWNGIFSQRRNAVSPKFLRMLSDIVRFNRQAVQDDEQQSIGEGTLEDYLKRLGVSRGFMEWYLLPMGAAIWSTPLELMLQYPASTFIRFFRNHGLLSIHDRPQWKTVVGGSHAYVHAFLKGFKGEVRPGSRLSHVRRLDEGVVLVHEDGSEERYDRVVIAAHADEALRLLADPSPDEQRLLGAWTYTQNHTVLHTDASILPSRSRTWASWNYTKERVSNPNQPVSVTYHMNRLQGLSTQHQYCVTLNRTQPIPSEHILREFMYTHPMYTLQSIATQKELPHLNGQRHTYFCGSYFGYGFHEDAVTAGLGVAKAFGIEL